MLQLAILGAVGAAAVWVYCQYPWLRYDLKWLRDVTSLLVIYSRMVYRRHFLVDVMEENAKKDPAKAMVIFQDNDYSYGFMNSQMNKMAHTADAIPVQRGQSVAIFMHNSPAFIWTYLGLVKMGAIPSFLNYNLRSKSLLHCFMLSDAKVLLMSPEETLLQAVHEILPELIAREVRVYVQGAPSSSLSEGFLSLDPLMEKASDAPISRTVRQGITANNTICHIYTSGTTGLPKAAIISHAKSLKATFFCTRATSGDVFYTPLPLYHSAAGLLGIGCVLRAGCTMVLREKFSASEYWDDCRKHGVTVIQYVGEMARYLTSKPKRTDDRDHKVKIAVGNGLRMDVWTEFQERFGIEQVIEFYAATEGNAAFINTFNKRGAIGRASPIAQVVFPTSLVQYDYDTAEPKRGADGFCIEVSKPAVQALMISKIKKNMEYEGYSGNKELSEKKILKDVFVKGDRYFNTGDLIYFDKDYFLYFGDRLGDTFRWKGENVSTTEVANTLTEVMWIQDASVYGVQIPGQEGRAGMAAILPREKLNELTADQLTDIFSACESLPNYAKPRFLRLKSELQMTGTFKNRKVEAVKEGFDPAKCYHEPLYVVDFRARTFMPLTPSVFLDICGGKLWL